MKKILSILLIFGLTIGSYADTIKIRQFKGLQTRSNPFNLEDGESPNMNNFILDEAGSIKERSLFFHYNTNTIGAYPLTNLYKFYTTADVGYMICSANKDLYSASGGDLTDVLTATTVLPNTQWEFESFTDGTNEYMYAANNGINLCWWNGIENVLPLGDGYGPAEDCNLLKKHKARLFASGSTEYPYRLYYSSLSNGTDWNTTGGTIDLPSFERIMKLEVLSDVLYLFTRTGIYALYGSTPNEFSIQKTRSTIGTHATKSVVPGNKLIFFLNKSGVFAFDGDTSTNLSETIQPTVDAISDIRIGDSAGLYDNSGKYWLAYTSENGSYNDRILVYDTVIKQWYRLNQANFASFFKAEGGTDKGELYAGCSNNIGFLWQLQVAGAEEKVIHSTQTQLDTGATWNTVIFADPIVELNKLNIDGEAVLSMHFDAPDGSTTFRDSSVSNHGNATRAGNAEIDTADFVYDGSSLLLDGVGSYIFYGDSPDWDVVASKTDDWTIGFWYKMASLPGAGNTYAIFHHRQNVGAYWRLSYTHQAGKGWEFVTLPAGANFSQAEDTGETDVWHYIVFSKVGEDYGLYEDGIQIAYGTSAVETNKTGNLYIGSLSTGSHFNGHLDEPLMVHSNIFDAAPNIGKTDTIRTPLHASSGTLISYPLQINVTGETTLGDIEWNEELEDDTDIQFQVRTGPTPDTVYFQEWEGWVSGLSVSVTTVTDATSWDSWDSINLTPLAATAQPRDILYYEDEDEVNPGSIRFAVTPTGQYVSAMTVVSPTDISLCKFIGYWLKSPVTGSSVRLGIAEVSEPSVIILSAKDAPMYTTATTTLENTWEKHYWPISNYISTDLDNISYIELTYLGDTDGDIYLGQVWAYDFLDSGDTMTSTPDDYIQYRAILGTTDKFNSPQLIEENNMVISLSYSTTAGEAETELTSNWQTKVFDNNTDYTKYWRWCEIDAKTSNPTTGNTVYLDYDVNDGDRTGTLDKTFLVTGSRVKIRFYFPSGTRGETIQLNLRDTDVDSDLEVRNMTIGFKTEGL